ncbi:hypothetical protein M409DRAFT_19593 [Zasmidium cellare ATCC 36951]|uniref:Aflatoxin regulatory protein domain-containing protein n=1 Tax=Zasmidium cellare ATCC 36951 TaxID=1080233 RepID=A0A6A6CRS3_ZASCE|nr:uncharacterized protein M409DRAFT_19593 [Zasmidium cellare ATCC 36951]KAF2169977.1 hypothetical protein M409DRAFT_19593 [Zasmidium cellare ATCC 36951]
MLQSLGDMATHNQEQIMDLQDDASLMVAFPASFEAKKLAEEGVPYRPPGKCPPSNVPAPLNALVHGCDREAYTILGELNCTASLITSLDTTQLSSNGAALSSLSPELSQDPFFQFDSILQRNKSAVDSLNQLLDCQCTQEPHIAMLYFSIIYKVLAWYQVAAHRLLTPGILPTNLKQRSGSVDSYDHETSKSKLISTFLRVGSFELDDTDQAALHRQLLLIEMRKVDGVIEKMITVLRKHSKTEISIAMSWCDLACLAMRAKLQETKELMRPASE